MDSRLKISVFALGLTIAGVGVWDLQRSFQTRTADDAKALAASRQSQAKPQIQPGRIPQATAATPAPRETEINASSKLARCVVKDRDAALEYDGSCNFRAQSDGSFSIEDAKSAQIIEYERLTVTVQSAGHAELSMASLLADGKPRTTVGGPLSRSTTDRACWESRRYVVCAY